MIETDRNYWIYTIDSVTLNDVWHEVKPIEEINVGNKTNSRTHKEWILEDSLGNRYMRKPKWIWESKPNWGNYTVS